MAERPFYKVLGLGAPIMDLILHVNDDFLKTHVPGEKGGNGAHRLS